MKVLIETNCIVNGHKLYFEMETEEQIDIGVEKKLIEKTFFDWARDKFTVVQHYEDED